MSRRRLNFFLNLSLAGLVTAALYLLVLSPFRLLDVPEQKFLDVFFRARHFFVPYRAPVLKDIFLVVVDDESLQRSGEKWPFKRQTYAELVDRLTKSGPLLIGLDLVFSGKSDPAGDFLFADALERSGRVILASFVDDTGNYIMPLEDFRRVARGVGIVNKLLDKDFSVRRNQLLFYERDGKVGGWPWEMVVAKEKLGFDFGDLSVDAAGVYRRLGEKLQFLFSASGKNAVMRINYRFGLEDVQSIPVSKVLSPEGFDQSLDGKIVLVGTSSKAIHDDYSTPMGIMSGVVINANVLVNLLTGDYLREIPDSGNALLLGLFVFLACLIAFRCDVARGLLILSGLTAGSLGFAFFAFVNNWIGDYFTPFLAGWVAFLSVTLYRYFRMFIENVKLKGEVVTDPLTGVYNRRFLESKIDAELERMAAVKGDRKTDPLEELSVLMSDIDNFKKINDTYGHQFGDDVLKTVSFSMKECTRRDDIVARYGGEEFCVVLYHTSKEAALQIAEKIRKNVESKEFNYVNQMARFTISIGLSSVRTDQLFSSRALLRAADKALYKAKKTGKNKVCLYDQSLELEETPDKP